MVAFWQLFLSLHILARHLCLPFLCTIAFCQLFRTRILATFALSYSRIPGMPPFWHVIPFLQLLLTLRSTVAFWQLLFTPYCRSRKRL